MPVLFWDLETRSTLGLKKVGAWRYSGEPATAVLCAAYAVDDGVVQIWTPGQPIPEEFHIAARDPTWLIVAHNAVFESSIAARILGPRYGWPQIPIERTRCTMAAALASALPGSLEGAAAALGLDVRKDADGKRLMMQMSKPRKPRKDEDPNVTHWLADPERLERLGEYCRRDVEVERELYRRVPALSESEQALWQLDALINRRGFAVDLELAEAARQIAHAALADVNRELAELTGGRITGVNQVARLTTLLEEHGHDVKGLAKRSVAAVLAHKPDELVKRVLELRQEGGKASASKLETLLASANAGRLHGTLKFHGAATGRWSGSGFQPHNLARAQPADAEAAIGAVLSGQLERVRAIGRPLDVIGSLSRSMICAAPGCELIGADFSGVEARITAWLAGEQWALDGYRRHDATGDPALDPYCLTASKILGRPVTPTQDADRQIGKMCTLAFGFGGGARAFKRIASDTDFTDAQIEKFKAQWRSAHPAIVRFWRRLHGVLLRALRTKAPATFQPFGAEMRGGNLYLRLPSGRELVYPEAHLEPGLYEQEIVFKDNAIGKWQDTRAWFGTFVENVVQAIARDLLAGAMPKLEAAGYPIVLHVHDEIVAEVPEGFGSTDEFARLMTELPPWAEGLPLVAKARRALRYAEAKAAPATETIEESRPLARARDDEPKADRALEATTIMSESDEMPIIETPSETEAPPETNEEAEITDAIIPASPAVAAAIAAMTAAMPRGMINGAAHEQQSGAQSRGSHGSYGDNTSEKHSGKRYTDAHLRARGYQLACTFFYELPDRTRLYEERRYELRTGVEPTKERPRKTCRFCHIVEGDTRFDTGPRRIIYHWPAILRAGPGATVHITEGANKSAALNAAGLLATAVAYHKWEPECVAALADCHLIIHEDHNPQNGDDPGPRLAADACDKLAPRARSVRIVPAAHLWQYLPAGARAIARGDDVKDWLELGGNPAELQRICDEIPVGAIGLGVWDAGDDALLDNPPPRAWLLSTTFARRFISSLIAAGGTGKTALRYAQYLSLATGRELTGERVFQRCRVMIVSLEDNADELRRRIRAVMLQYGIERADLRGWLFLSAPGAHAGKLLALNDKGRPEPGHMAAALERDIGKFRPDLVGLDPFVKTHSVSENDNAAIDDVVQTLADLAIKYDIAIDTPHHARKGPAEPGDADRGRGASASKDAFRLTRTLTTMSIEEAEAFGIAEEQRKLYLRVDNAKVNIAPPMLKAQWFRLVGVQLGNPTEQYPDGDNVQTVEPWTPPEIWQDLDAALLNRILDATDAGLPDGNRYPDAAKAGEREAWQVVIEHAPEKTKAQGREIISTWVRTGVLAVKQYQNPKTTKFVNGLYVVAAKRPAQPT